MKIYLSILVFVGILINSTAATSSVRAVDTNLFTGSITVSNLTTLTIPMADSSTKKLVDSPLSVSSGTNASLTGNLSLHDLNVTNDTTIGGSLNLSGANPANIALNAGGTISNGGGDFALTNDLPVHFASNVVVGLTITDSAGSVGTSGQVLKSGGAGAGTTWGAAGSYLTVQGASSIISAPADTQTHYFGNTFSLSSSTTSTRYRLPAPLGASTLIGYKVWVNISGTLASAEDVAVDLFLDNTTSIGAHNEQWTSADIVTEVSGLSQAVTSSSLFSLRVVYPAWATNPTNVLIGFQMVFE